MLLHRMIDEAALRHPEAPAVRCDGATLTYEQLARHANGLARVLLGTGLQRRDRVAVLLGKGLNVPVGFYGALAAGGTLVPIDPRSPVEQVVRILRATGATHLVTEPGKRGVVLEALAACPRAGARGRPRARRRDAPSVGAVGHGRRRSQRPAAGRGGDRARSVLHPPHLGLHRHPEAHPAHPPQRHELRGVGGVRVLPDPRRPPEQPLLAPHLLRHLRLLRRRPGGGDHRHPDAGGADDAGQPVDAPRGGAGLGVVLGAHRPRPALAARRPGETGPARRSDGSSSPARPSPRSTCDGSCEQLPGARFSHVYGSTEVNVCTYSHLPEDGDLGDPLPIGKACSNSSTLVVDDDLQPVPDGEMGELLVRGSTVMSGYWGEPERNRSVLVRRPSAGGLEEVYFRTGDRVRVLDDGTLTFVARADRQVKVRGSPRGARGDRDGAPVPRAGRGGGGLHGPRRRGQPGHSRGGGGRRGRALDTPGDPGATWGSSCLPTPCPPRSRSSSPSPAPRPTRSTATPCGRA